MPGSVTVHEMDIDLGPTILDILDEVGEICAGVISSNSPVGHRGKYAAGWTHKLDYDGNEQVAVVYNKDQWQLSHLLEKGHYIVTIPQQAKVKDVMWSPAIPHIKPAFDQVAPYLMEQMKSIRLGRAVKAKV